MDGAGKGVAAENNGMREATSAPTGAAGVLLGAPTDASVRAGVWSKAFGADAAGAVLSGDQVRGGTGGRDEAGEADRPLGLPRGCVYFRMS